MIDVGREFMHALDAARLDRYGEDSLSGGLSNWAGALVSAIEATIDSDIWLDYVWKSVREIKEIALARPGGFVYVLEAGEFYKIGRSSRLDNRIKTLAIQLPFPVRVLTAFPCEDAAATERWLHELFSEYRVNGEWFRIPDQESPRIGTEWLKEIRFVTEPRIEEIIDMGPSRWIEVPPVVAAQQYWERALIEADAAREGVAS